MVRRAVGPFPEPPPTAHFVNGDSTTALIAGTPLPPGRLGTVPTPVPRKAPQAVYRCSYRVLVTAHAVASIRCEVVYSFRPPSTPSVVWERVYTTEGARSTPGTSAGGRANIPDEKEPAFLDSGILLDVGWSIIRYSLKLRHPSTH